MQCRALYFLQQTNRDIALDPGCQMNLDFEVELNVNSETSSSKVSICSLMNA